jgi:hypothetical protein
VNFHAAIGAASFSKVSRTGIKCFLYFYLNTNRKRHRFKTAQGNPPRCFLLASIFIFHARNLREQTLSKREAEKYFRKNSSSLLKVANAKMPALADLFGSCKTSPART